MSDVLFPEMTTDADATGVITTWFAENGDDVQTGDLIAEVAMDKVDAEVVAAESGVLTILVAEEAEVAQGAAIGRIDPV